MKTIYKAKNWLYSVAILLITACLCVIGGFMLSEKPKTVASAATEGGITFETGASIRIDTVGDTSGIRFTAIVSDSVYNAVTENGEIKENAELGMIIVPQTYVDAFNKAVASDYFSFFSQKIAKGDISVSFTTDMLTRVAGGYQMRGALVKVFEKNYERDYRAIAYYTVDGGETYTYYINEGARNVLGVSVSAIQNEENDKPNGYTEAELNVLYTYTNGSIPRVLYDASKQSHTQLLNVNTTDATVSQANGAFAIALNETPANNVLVITPEFLTNADLKKYEGGNIYFTVRTNAANATCTVAGSKWDLKPDTDTTVSAAVTNYTSSFTITIRGLAAADSVWISDIAVCVKHKGINWVYPTSTSHNGECSICQAGIEGACTAGTPTYVSNDDGTHIKSAACSVCPNVLSVVEEDCTFVNGVCKHCGQEKICQHTNVSIKANANQTHSKICDDCGETLPTEDCTFVNGVCKHCGQEKVCQHTNVSIQANANKTHSKTCDDCGETLPTEACTAGTPTYASNDDGTHIKTTACSVCPNVLSTVKKERCTYVDGVCQHCKYKHINHCIINENEWNYICNGTALTCYYTAGERAHGCNKELPLVNKDEIVACSNHSEHVSCEKIVYDMANGKHFMYCIEHKHQWTEYHTIIGGKCTICPYNNSSTGGAG